MVLSDKTFVRWNERIADAVGGVNSSGFAEKLKLALGELTDFDICMVFAYSETSPSKCLFHNLDETRAKIIVDDYLSGPYLLDPFYTAMTKGKHSGFGAMRSLAPDQFYRSEFFRHHYVRTAIADEIGIFFPLPDHTTAVLSIARQAPKKHFSNRAKKLISSVAQIVERLAVQHWSNAERQEQFAKNGNSIEAVFENFGLGILTAREKEIVALVLKGHSSGSIGKVLGISEGTVKIHRKNAYDKLKISSQAELFSLFLKSLDKHWSM